MPRRLNNGEYVFSDYDKFRPNLSPKEIMKQGAFGGTYWRTINSCVGNQPELKNQYKKLPSSWWKGIPLDHMTLDWEDYNKEINKYGVQVGETYSYWCTKNWITNHDPYGWYQWYCNFFKGRRCLDDERQIKRWSGVRSRFGNRLINMLKQKHKTIKDINTVSPKIAQTLHHWAIELKSHHLR
tara:strand:- start:1322 stop:1870 length:549 start_codon:yes stop_codon:yes gene_type:complete